MFIGIVAGDGADMRLALVENERSQDSWPSFQAVKARFAETSDWATAGYTTATQEIADRTHHMTDSMAQAVETTSKTFHKSLDLTANTITRTVDEITNTTSSTIQSAIETMNGQSNAWIERSRSGLADFANTIQTAVQLPHHEFMSGWLEQHPIIHWMVDHPLGAAALLVLALVLLGGLFRAIAYTTEQLWIAILRLPIQLGRWGWRLISSGFKPAIVQPVLPTGDEEQHRERLTYVLQRLDAIKQEQDRLLKELQELLG